MRAAIHVGIGCVGINDTRVIFPAAAATHVACETQAGDRNNQDQDETQCDNLFHDTFLLFLSEQSAEGWLFDIILLVFSDIKIHVYNC